MKWLEKHFVRKKEMVAVLNQLIPGERSSGELAKIVYEVRKFRKNTAGPVEPTARAIDSAMLRSFRTLGITAKMGERVDEKGNKKRVIVYPKN
jgi:hypothetical protein